MLLANNLLQLQSIFGATFVRKHICALSSRVEYAGQCQTAYSVSTLVWRWMGWAKYEETRHIGSLTVFFTSQPTKPKVVVEEWEAIPQHCVTSTRSRCPAVVAVYVLPHAVVMTLMSSEFNKWHQIEDLATFSNLWQNVAPKGEINKPGLRLIANQVN